jgi:cytochrome c
MRKVITAFCGGWLAAIAALAVASGTESGPGGQARTKAVAEAADAVHGKQVFAACAACHSDKPDAIGPSLRGVYGRKSGSLEDFRYSNAMMRANLTWNDDNLRAYIKDPQAKVPGNRMPFGGLQDEKDVDDVIAYLKTYR